MWHTIRRWMLDVGVKHTSSSRGPEANASLNSECSCTGAPSPMPFNMKLQNNYAVPLLGFNSQEVYSLPYVLKWLPLIWLRECSRPFGAHPSEQIAGALIAIMPTCVGKQYCCGYTKDSHMSDAMPTVNQPSYFQVVSLALLTSILSLFLSLATHQYVVMCQ